MENRSISVIVPIYNAGQILSVCIDSILQQSCSDFELLLIDDGSTDRSSEIADDYASRYGFITVVHQQNRGVSAARNRGLSLARGKYVVFIDADDRIDKDCLSSLMRHAGSSDICIGNMVLVYSDTLKTVHPLPTQLFSTHDEMLRFLLSLFPLDLPISACNCLLRRSVIEEYQLRFDEQIRVCEDTEFIFRYLNHINSMQVFGDANYYYRMPSDTKFYGSHNGLYASLQLLEGVYALTDNEEIRSAFRSYYLDWSIEELFHYNDILPLKPLAVRFARLCQPYIRESRRPSFRHRLFRMLCVSDSPAYIIRLSRFVMSIYKTLRRCPK